MIPNDKLQQLLVNMGARHAAEIDSVYYGTGFVFYHDDGTAVHIPAADVVFDGNGYHIQAQEEKLKLTPIIACELQEYRSSITPRDYDTIIMCWDNRDEWRHDLTVVRGDSTHPLHRGFVIINGEPTDIEVCECDPPGTYYTHVTVEQNARLKSLKKTMEES